MVRLWTGGWGRAVTPVSMPLAREGSSEMLTAVLHAARLEGWARGTFSNYLRLSRS